MRLDELMSLEEAIVTVPQHWVDAVVSRYREALLNAYAMTKGESAAEQKQILKVLGGRPSETDIDIMSGSRKTKLTILANALPLRDDKNETFIDDTTVTLVAFFNPDNRQSGGYTQHAAYTHLLVINLAVLVTRAIHQKLDINSAKDYLLRSLREIIEHELVYLIQHEKGNQSQLKQNPGYNKSQEEYWKSPVEFNAQITTFIRDFEKKLETISPTDKTFLGYENIINALLFTIGYQNRWYKATGHERIDREASQAFNALASENGFMYTLRDKKPSQWKQAVKAITKHFTELLK